MSEVTLAEVKTALNKQDTKDDVELQRIIDAAEAEYAQYVRPLPGDHPLRVFIGRSVQLPPGTTAIVSGAFPGGGTINVAGLDLDPATGIAYAIGGVFAGASSYGNPSGQITLTVTLGPLPLNHRETIIADVAGLFSATQRGGGSGRPSFGGDGYAEALNNPTGPLVLFPRIRAIAAADVLA